MVAFATHWNWNKNVCESASDWHFTDKSKNGTRSRSYGIKENTFETGHCKNILFKLCEKYHSKNEKNLSGKIIKFVVNFINWKIHWRHNWCKWMKLIYLILLYCCVNDKQVTDTTIIQFLKHISNFVHAQSSYSYVNDRGNKRIHSYFQPSLYVRTII